MAEDNKKLEDTLSKEKTAESGDPQEMFKSLFEKGKKAKGEKQEGDKDKIFVISSPLSEADTSDEGKTKDGKPNLIKILFNEAPEGETATEKKEITIETTYGNGTTKKEKMTLDDKGNFSIVESSILPVKAEDTANTADTQKVGTPQKTEEKIDSAKTISNTATIKEYLKHINDSIVVVEAKSEEEKAKIRSQGNVNEQKEPLDDTIKDLEKAYGAPISA